MRSPLIQPHSTARSTRIRGETDAEGTSRATCDAALLYSATRPTKGALRMSLDNYVTAYALDLNLFLQLFLGA